MNFDRSTEGGSPLRWLNVVQRGGTGDWRRLYRLCRQRDFARQVAALLRHSDPDSLPACRLWLRLLEDLHPGVSQADESRTAAASLAVGNSPAVVDGRVIVGSEDESVYCFGTKATK